MSFRCGNWEIEDGGEARGQDVLAVPDSSVSLVDSFGQQASGRGPAIRCRLNNYEGMPLHLNIDPAEVLADYTEE